MGESVERTALDFGLWNPDIEEGKRTSENPNASEHGVTLRLTNGITKPFAVSANKITKLRTYLLT